MNEDIPMTATEHRKRMGVMEEANKVVDDYMTEVRRLTHRDMVNRGVIKLSWCFNYRRPAFKLEIKP